MSYLRRAADPWAFLTELGRINEPPPGLGLVPYQPWEHLRRLVVAIQGHRLVVVLKARQLGITWTLAGYALWRCLFHEGANVLVLSKGEDEAKEILSRVRLMWRELPPEHKLSLGTDQASLLTFPATGSRIRALPSTEDAGRTEAASDIITDEWDFHPYAQRNFSAVKPAIDAGGRFIGGSTSDRLRQDTFFKVIWRGAPENGFTPLFFDWRQRPGRDQAWYERMLREYQGDAAIREQEYPGSPEEALAPSQEACWFEIETLARLKTEAQAGWQFRPPVIGRRYAAWIDPAGQGADRHSLSILDCQTGMFVVDQTREEPIEAFAAAAFQTLTAYGNPLLGIENNGVGLAMVTILRGLGYPEWRLVYQDEKRTKCGVVMTSSLRDRILVNLQVAVRQGTAIVVSREAIGEMYSFVRAKGKVQAAQGAHDDRVMAMAGALWVSGQVPPSQTVRMRSLEYAKA